MAAVFLWYAAPLAIAAQPATSQGYSAKKDVSNGAVVSLDNTDLRSIEEATVANRSRLVGVAINRSQALVNLDDSVTSTVQVISSGQSTVQVSTANGSISSGDALSPSPVAGVAMKATSPGRIIGKAQEDFNESKSNNTSADITKIELTDQQGNKKSVVVGKIAVAVSVEDWSPDGQPNSPIVNSIRSFLGSAVGKPVSNAQALLSIGIMVVAVIIASIILYSAVSSSIHSIGRNPLSKNIIRRSLIVMVIVALAILVAACLAVYLILGGS